MLFLNMVVFLNSLGAIPLKPIAMESVSNAPIAAPPAIAAPGAFPPLSFISLDISPAPINIDGKKAPNIPPPIPPTAAPTGPPKAAPAAPNVFAPAMAVGKVAAILVATCGKALLNNQSAASPTSVISSKVFSRLPDSKAGCTSCCPRSPALSKLSKPVASPMASTPAEALENKFCAVF